MRFVSFNFLWPILLLWGLGMEASLAAQVPNHQERIRKTTREILDQPEFGLFPRLKPGKPASGISSRSSGAGIPRLKSSTGRPAEPGNGGAAQDRGNQLGPIGGPGNGNRPEPQRRQANRFPQEMPGENPRRANGNPENAQDALGNDDLFPEAGNLEGIENQNLKIDPPDQPNPGDANNGNQPANKNNNPNNIGPGQQANPPGMNQNPQQAGPNGNPPNADANNPGAGNPQQAGGGVNPNPNDALPAPRPRESTTYEQYESAARPAEASGFARMVGTIFHVMAWTILAVICGLIVWLIGKAILEFERPASLVPVTGDSGSALDLEPSRAPGELPADVYITHARKLAEQGQYREAVVQLLLGAMSRVERAGWVRFRRGMTVRDYLRGIHQHPAAYQGMRSIVRVFEPLTFGRREPTQEHFDRSLEGYESGFGGD